LKGSLMDSFTLELTPKIDFTQTRNIQQQRLESYRIFNSP
jgi:hypothetical protein